MPKRQFERPAPGNQYTKAQRDAWGAEQDRLRAARAAQPQPTQLKPTAKRPSRSKPLIADTTGSTCFDSLVYRSGVVTASFIGPAAGEWQYEMSRADAKEWFNDPESLGKYFNDNVR
jgi:hypothetical protein